MVTNKHPNKMSNMTGGQQLFLGLVIGVGTLYVGYRLGKYAIDRHMSLAFSTPFFTEKIS